MSSTKGLSHLEVDYSDGYDVDGVQISGRVLEIICARIPPEEFTYKRVINDCLSFGFGYRDNKKLMDDWAEEDQLKISQKHGRNGGLKTSITIKDIHDDWQITADSLFKNNPDMSIRAASRMIARDSIQDWGKQYSPDHIKKYIKKS
jgi:hypothetical protein